MARGVRWRGMAAKVVDKALLVGALGTWWFVLRPDAAVVDAVDSVSYLIAVYSAWSSVRAVIIRLRPARDEVAGSDEGRRQDRDLTADRPARDERKTSLAVDPLAGDPLAGDSLAVDEHPGSR